MTDALTFKKHIFGHAVGAWGHNKPLITLAVLISELRKDIAFTILTNPTMYPKIMGELGKLPRERLKPIEMQINVLQVIPPHPDPFYSAPEIGIEFKKLYEQNGVVTCLASGKTIDCAYFPRPSVAIIDPFAEYALDGIRAYASPEEVPIISWMTGSAGPLLSMWGPEKYGGKGDVVSKLKEEMQNSGKSELEAFYSENVFGTTDKVVQIPGFPPFYDYERVTQPMNDEFKGLNMHAVLNGSRFMAKSEAIIAISSSVLEGEAVEACRELFSSMGKSFFAIGPMPTIPAPEKVGENNTETARVVSFLDEMHSRFGDKSVLYISFGTFFWPPDGATFRVLVDELVESKTPFILAHPSPLFRPEESLLESIRACPTAIEVPWAPQERILTHEATGWFLTHGGWNSIQEALLYKVPLIMWPMGADQPLNALLLSEKFKVAIELLEVRESSNSRRPYRLRDQPHSESPKDEFKRVLSDIKGEKGALIRNNLESLSKKVGGVWGREGEARRELDAFLNKYVG